MLQNIHCKPSRDCHNTCSHQMTLLFRAISKCAECKISVVFLLAYVLLLFKSIRKGPTALLSEQTINWSPHKHCRLEHDLWYLLTFFLCGFNELLILNILIAVYSCSSKFWMRVGLLLSGTSPLQSLRCYVYANFCLLTDKQTNNRNISSVWSTNLRIICMKTRIVFDVFKRMCMSIWKQNSLLQSLIRREN